MSRCRFRAVWGPCLGPAVASGGSGARIGSRRGAYVIPSAGPTFEAPESGNGGLRGGPKILCLMSLGEKFLRKSALFIKITILLKPQYSLRQTNIPAMAGLRIWALLERFSRVFCRRHVSNFCFSHFFCLKRHFCKFFENHRCPVVKIRFWATLWPSRAVPGAPR